MEAKPYSIQPPEEIAKAYGGDKQRIMQAAQMGIVDPTAALLAGMFVDRMRAPQATEGTNPPTVAQQVLGGLPPVAPSNPQAQAPMPPAGGLGTLPQEQAPPPAPTPDMGQPEQPIGMADGGMVPPNQTGNLNNGAPAPYPMPYQMGTPGANSSAPPSPYQSAGLDGLPVPDTMFDENRNGGFNDGYAGGGLVAFADGGSEGNAPLGPWFEKQAMAAVPGVGVTSRKRDAAHNAQVGGVKNSYHLTDNARDFVPPKGMNMGQLHSQLKNVFGAGYDVLNEGDHIHIEPGNRSAPKLPQVNVANRDQRTRSSLLDDIGVAGQLLGGMPHQRRDELAAYMEKQRSPEQMEKRRKEDMWSALAQLGGTLASTPGSFLSAVGESIAKTMPGVVADRKERKAAEREAYQALGQIEELTRKDKKDIIEFGKDIWAADVSAEEKQQALAAQIEQKRLDREHDSSENALQRQSALEIAKARPTNPSDLETKVSWVMQAGLAKDPVSAMNYLKANGLIGAPPATTGIPGLGAIQPGAQPGSAAGGDEVNLGTM